MLDRNFTKFILLTPGTQQLPWQHAASENPQGSTQTHGERPEFQWHRLSAGWHRKPRSDPGDHRHQPEPGSHWRSQDHVAELRRGVRAGDGGRRFGADQLGQEQVLRQCVRVLPQQRAPGAQPVHTANRTRIYRRTQGISSGSRSAARSCRTGCFSSATTRAPAAPRAGPDCCRCRPPRARTATSATTA